MEKIRYSIIDADDNEEWTYNVQEARKAFLNGQIVHVHKEVVLYTEEAQITLTVTTDMKL